MGEIRKALKTPDTAITMFDVVIERALIILLVFMPFAFGARRAWSEQVVIILSGFIVVCFLLKLVVHKEQRMIWSAAYVPLAVFLFIIALQAIPLPRVLVSLISPNTVALRTELLGDMPAAAAHLQSMPLSFYPHATVHDIRIVLSAAGVFVVVLNVFRSARRIKRLLMVISLIGGAVVLITLAQTLFGNGKIYWFLPNPAPAALSGPFVNHSHYAQFMNLSIGAAIGWLCVKLHEDFAGRKVSLVAVFDYLCHPSTRIAWIFVAIASLGAATVFISLSRGGMVSVLIAGCLTTQLLCSRRSLKAGGWVMVIMALAAFICILATGFDAVYERFATLSIPERYGCRLQILTDLKALFRLFPILGAGMGAHLVVYPMFQSVNTTALFTHVENEYAQLIEETGLIGFFTLAVFGGIVVSAYLKNIRHSRFPISSAAYGLGFGLLAILIHSFSDFGQHVPANAFLSAIFCALLLSVARYEGRGDFDVKGCVCTAGVRWFRVVFLMGVSVIFLWSVCGAVNAGVAESYRDKVIRLEKGLSARDWQGTDAQYAELIENASAAVSYQPGNVFYRYYLNVYRWYSIIKAGGADADVEAAVANSMDTVRDIDNEFNKARMVCPTYGPLYSLAGQIEKFIFNDDAGAEKIRKGYTLAPRDPTACFVAGRLDALEGNLAGSVEKFDRAVQLDSTLFRDVVDIYVRQLSRPQLAVSAAGNDIDKLIYTANVLSDMQYYDLQAGVRSKVKGLLEQQCSRPDASALSLVMLADIYAKERDAAVAINFYRRAIALDYGQVRWRMELAGLLVQDHRVLEAMKEARICLRLQPKSKPAEELIRKLAMRPELLNENRPGQ